MAYDRTPGAGALHRLDAGSTLDAVIEGPVRKVTACALGGARLDERSITTSRERLAPDDEPLAGSLFRADVGLVGQPVRPFAG
jgi:sugar lactone lactonase YvrE